MLVDACTNPLGSHLSARCMGAVAHELLSCGASSQADRLVESQIVSINTLFKIGMATTLTEGRNTLPGAEKEARKPLSINHPQVTLPDSSLKFSIHSRPCMSGPG